jgi:hypothetical protein
MGAYIEGETTQERNARWFREMREMPEPTEWERTLYKIEDFIEGATFLFLFVAFIWAITSGSREKARVKALMKKKERRNRS